MTEPENTQRHIPQSRSTAGLALLPCPFCGVELKKYSGCACGSCKGGVWHDNKECVFGSKVFSGHMTELDMAAFAEKWNKRANVK